MTYKILSFLVLVIFLTFFGNCEKETVVVTETVTLTDTIVVVQQDTIYLTLTDTVTIVDLLQDTVTSFILVRHAETTGIGSDPDLSTDGTARAQVLANVLQSTPLDAVYSSNFNRTRQTAQAVADDQALPVAIYNPFNLDNFADEVLETHPARKVLVVGHSNTTPDLMNVLTGTDAYEQFEETDYSNLIIVSVLEKGRAEVVWLKYGE